MANMTAAIIKKGKEEAEKAKAEEMMQLRKQEMEAKSKQFEASLEELADRAIEARMTRGEEDSITVLLVNFLEIAIEMRDVMKTLEAINSAMECVTEAIQFLDSAIEMDQEMMSASLEHKYGLFSRMKQRMKARRVVRNHNQRMKQIITNLTTKMKMAEGMVVMMKKFSVNMQKSLQRKKKKKGAADNAPAISSRAAELMARRAKEKGVDVTPTTATTDTASGTAPASGEGTIGGVDIFPHSN